MISMVIERSVPAARPWIQGDQKTGIDRVKDEWRVLRVVLGVGPPLVV